MKQLEEIINGNGYAAVSVGPMNELSEYVLTLGPNVKINGKVFLGQKLGTSGSEISFQSFAPSTETGFLHTHKNHEELYIFVSGNGEFLADGKVFKVCEGTIVRVSPSVKCSVRNNGTKPLVMICIQYKADTFTAEDAADGVILQEPVVW